MPILTGAASEAERARLEHRLVGFVPIGRTFSVGEFMPLAHAEIDGALASGRTPIVVGGTGLYLRAALSQLDLRPAPPAGLRRRLEEEADEVGSEAMHARLAQRAPQAAERVPAGDRSRVIRLLELLEMGALEAEEPRVESQLWTEETRHPTLLAGLTMDRAELYERIDRRVDSMVGAGALEEVRAAHDAGASPTARKALGFEELLVGDIEGMKRRSRQYARRQLTWMRKLPNVELLDVTRRAPEDVAAEIASRAA
ncbi:MAG: tRNA dimethylallyltransferase [Thermoleophilaceae bacterium]|jgi:tRNA dimethylallyltransferase|nr:tRNA dimethylallyltransferase [Thermoleophilaceae bacterium]